MLENKVAEPGLCGCQLGICSARDELDYSCASLLFYTYSYRLCPLCMGDQKLIGEFLTEDSM